MTNNNLIYALCQKIRQSLCNDVLHGVHQILYNLFRANSSLILLFMKKNLLNTDNLYEPLIDLYLCKDISDDYKEIIEKILKLINSNITLPKSPFHYIY